MMWYPVTVECRNIVELRERQGWAQEYGMNVVNRTWEVIDKRQCVTFNFEQKQDATLFALRWS